MGSYYKLGSEGSGERLGPGFYAVVGIITVAITILIALQ